MAFCFLGCYKVITCFYVLTTLYSHLRFSPPPGTVSRQRVLEELKRLPSIERSHDDEKESDMSLIFRLIRGKLQDRSTYVVALIVGTLISLYGQVFVPWIRGGGDPFVVFRDEFAHRPYLTMSSIFLAYAFPLCVGIYSAVAARYKNRRVESIADFPERKPDPVFRVALDGSLVELGARTREFFEKYNIDSAQKILGLEAWEKVKADRSGQNHLTVSFDPEGAEYLVRHTPTTNDQINVYLTRLPA